MPAYRVTIRIGRFKHAEAEAAVRDPQDDRDVEEAAKRVVAAAGKSWPRTPVVEVAEHQGARKGWVRIRKVTL